MKNKTITEIKNWFYIRRTIKKQKIKRDSLWYFHKLRSNWYGRIYTVLSLREEDMGEEALVQNWKAMEMMRPINEYLQSLDFHEIVYPSIEKIPDSRSYLVVYSPIFEHLKPWKIILPLGILISGIIALFVFL